MIGKAQDITCINNRANTPIKSQIIYKWWFKENSKTVLSQMLMAIFVAYSNSGITSGKKFFATSNGGHFGKGQI